MYENTPWLAIKHNYEKLYLLGYNTVRSAESQPTLRNISPPSSGYKSSACYLLQAGFLLSSFFDSEEIGDIFLQNGIISQNIYVFIITAARTSNPTKRNVFGIQCTPTSCLQLCTLTVGPMNQEQKQGTLFATCPVTDYGTIQDTPNSVPPPV
jgi:hypothetical protein